MNPIVFAMRRPLTVMVLVAAVALGSGLALLRMPIDIFPNLNLPVIFVAQPYPDFRTLPHDFPCFPGVGHFFSHYVAVRIVTTTS